MKFDVRVRLRVGMTTIGLLQLPRTFKLGLLLSFNLTSTTTSGLLSLDTLKMAPTTQIETDFPYSLYFNRIL